MAGLQDVAAEQEGLINLSEFFLQRLCGRVRQRVESWVRTYASLRHKQPGQALQLSARQRGVLESKLARADLLVEMRVSLMSDQEKRWDRSVLRLWRSAYGSCTESDEQREDGESEGASRNLLHNRSYARPTKPDAVGCIRNLHDTDWRRLCELAPVGSHLDDRTVHRASTSWPDYCSISE